MVAFWVLIFSRFTQNFSRFTRDANGEVFHGLPPLVHLCESTSAGLAVRRDNVLASTCEYSPFRYPLLNPARCKIIMCTQLTCILRLFLLVCFFAIQISKCVLCAHFWEGRKVPARSLFEQEAPKIGTGVFHQTRCSRTFACRICPEQQRAGQGRSVREKSVRANSPIKIKK